MYASVGVSFQKPLGAFFKLQLPVKPSGFVLLKYVLFVLFCLNVYMRSKHNKMEL